LVRLGSSVGLGVRGHLEALQTRFPDQLGSCEIQDSGGTDYAYRLFVAKPAWMQVVDELVGETDYDNFKSESPATKGRQERLTSTPCMMSGRR